MKDYLDVFDNRKNRDKSNENGSQAVCSQLLGFDLVLDAQSKDGWMI